MSITYRGVTLPYAKHNGEVPERGKKIIAFPAVDWIEEMHFGKRGQEIIVEGLLPDIQNGTVNIDKLEEWNDTNVGTLVIHGKTYTNCTAKGRWYNIRKDVVTDKLTSEYTITFKKLK